MVRTFRRAVPLALALALAVQWPATAAPPTGNVSIQNFAFSPATGTGPLGTKVIWTNKDSTVHTTTNDTTNPDGSAGLGLWDSGPLGRNQTYRFSFPAAGHFTYHCQPHPWMTAEVKIRPDAQPASGAVGSTFTITLAQGAPPPAFVLDVQKRNPGGGFQNWMTGVTSASVQFVPDAAGSYEFRSRVRRVSTGGASLYSPPVAITVG